MLDYAFTDSLLMVDPVEEGFNVSDQGSVSRRAMMLDTQARRTGILGETVLPPFRPGRAGFPLQPQGTPLPMSLEGMWARLTGPSPGDSDYEPPSDNGQVGPSNGAGAGGEVVKPTNWKPYAIGAGVAVGIGVLWYYFLR